jgi:hypothetical protein
MDANYTRNDNGTENNTAHIFCYRIKSIFYSWNFFQWQLPWKEKYNSTCLARYLHNHYRHITILFSLPSNILISSISFFISSSDLLSFFSFFFYFYSLIIILSGVRLSPLGTAATTGLFYQPQMTDDGDRGAIDGMKIGREYRSVRIKPAPALLCPPQIPHDHTRSQTRDATVGSRRLNAWAMARPFLFLSFPPTYFVYLFFTS